MRKLFKSKLPNSQTMSTYQIFEQELETHLGLLKHKSNMQTNHKYVFKLLKLLNHQYEAVLFTC